MKGEREKVKREKDESHRTTNLRTVNHPTTRNLQAAPLGIEADTGLVTNACAV